ncbi:tetratricopeptide repeat protein [Kordia sp.]|uniref:tetratricopeptide repeat protein n=1 Tax=Kordia sp. TaxID=1965332 RepID=UPI003B5CA6E6
MNKKIARIILLGILLLFTRYNSFSQQANYTEEIKEQTLQHYINQGFSLQKQGSYQESITFFLDAIVLAKETGNDDLLFSSYAKLGKSYLYSGKSEKVLEAYYNALELAKRNENVEQELIAYSGLIAFLPSINKKEDAVNFSLYALNLIDKTSFRNKKRHVQLLTTVCDAFMAKDDYDDMFLHMELGIQLAKKLDYQAGLVDLYIKKGKYYHYKKQWDKAFQYLNKCKGILKKGKIAGSFLQTINANLAIARCFYDQGKYEEAIQELLYSTEIIKKEDQQKDNVIQTYSLLADCYQKKGNYKEASTLREKAMLLKDIARKGKDVAIDKFYEKDINNLLSKIAALQHHGKAQKQTINYMLWGILLVAMAFLLTLLLYIKKQKENKTKFNVLIEKISTLETSKKSISSKKAKSTEKNIRLDDDKIKNILVRLDKLEAQEYFLKSSCNLHSIAKKTKTNSTYISQIINTYKEKSFNEYINDLRIEYVLKRLKNDEKFRMFSIKGIATEIGYKSTDSFVKHFKKETGLNPSYYIKQLNKIEV